MGRSSGLLAAALAAVAMTITAGPETPGRRPPAPAFDAEGIPWTRLRFEARKLFLKGTTDIRLSSLATSELNGQLIASPEGVALLPAGPQTSLLELRSTFAGRESESRVWFDPDRAFAFQRHKRRYGGKVYQKIYRFTRDGVFSQRRSPRNVAESRRPAAEWGRVEDAFYRHRGDLGGCDRIGDPALLFYLASAAALDRSPEAVTFCAFSGKSLHRVELRPDGRTSLAVDYRHRSAAGETARRRGTIEVLKVSATARPLDPGAADSFELLGLEGDVELFVAERIPVRVSGRLPGLGRISVRMVEVDLK